MFGKQPDHVSSLTFIQVITHDFHLDSDIFMAWTVYDNKIKYTTKNLQETMQRQQHIQPVEALIIFKENKI